MFRSLARFFVYSNLFIAVCAVLMLEQTFSFLLRHEINGVLVAFVFSSTLCSYSFHWFLTSHSLLPSERIQWLKKYKTVHVIFFVLGAVGAAITFFQLIAYWEWLAMAAVATFLYSAPKIPHPLFRMLRKVALGKTIFLAFVWMFVTTVLPIVVVEHEWKPAYWLFVTGRFFFIYAICVLFDYRDRADDKQAGIRSLITYFDEKGIAAVFIVSLLIATIMTLLLLNYQYSVTDVALLMVPVLITAALYNYARRHFQDMFYYFVMDGLMALSALLMLVRSLFN